MFPKKRVWKDLFSKTLPTHSEQTALFLYFYRLCIAEAFTLLSAFLKTLFCYIPSYNFAHTTTFESVLLFRLLPLLPKVKKDSSLAERKQKVRFDSVPLHSHFTFRFLTAQPLFPPYLIYFPYFEYYLYYHRMPYYKVIKVIKYRE